jgi:hypothetical protein
MRRTSPAVAVASLFVAALVVGGTITSLGLVIAFGAGGLVLLGATFGRLRLALVPLAIAAGLAAVAVAAPSPDVGEEWTRVVAMLLVVVGIGASLCVALGALVRRLGLMRSTEGSD